MGDTIAVVDRGTTYYFDVLRLKTKDAPVGQVSIIDVNLEVEFERPIDMPDSPVRRGPAAARSNAGGDSGMVGRQSSDLLAGINFDLPSKDGQPAGFVPPSLKPAGGSLSAAANSVSSTPPAPQYTPFAGQGRSVSGKPIQQQQPPPIQQQTPSSVTAQQRHYANPGSAGGAPMLPSRGGPTVAPAAAAPTLSAPTAPSSFQPFAGAGRSMK